MKKKITKAQLEKRQYEAKRDFVIKQINELEKKYGKDIVRSACNRKLIIDRETQKREETIKKMEIELQRLKKGKLVN